MNKKYKFGIIGCGRISERHLKVISLLPNAAVGAVCDIDIKKAQKAARECGAPYYGDYIEMIKKEKPDIVSILTPSGMHARMALSCADYMKNIILEKPMALKLSDADLLIEKCLRKNINLFVVKQNRYNLPIQKLKEAVVRGRFGKIVLATVRVRWCRRQDYYDTDKWRGSWAMDGGVLTNQASHHIDLLQWLVGPVESVVGKTATQLVNIEAEDTGLAILKFTSGALGLVEATTATRPNDLEGSISILGEKGSVEIGGFAVNEIKHWNFEEELPEDLEVKEKYSVNPPNVYGFGHLEFIRKVLESLDNKTEPPVDGMEGRKSLELINAIYESAETGREVYLRFKPEFCKLGGNVPGGSSDI